jgi:hypothetical protein
MNKKPRAVEDGSEIPFVRPNDKDIEKAYEELREKVWWNRHQVWLEWIESGKEPMTEAQKPILEKAKKAARRIERKYGKGNLTCNNFEWGLVCGRMSALGWVMGDEWDALDT